MEKIYFDNSTYFWKTKLNLTQDKTEQLKEANELILNKKINTTDGFGYLMVDKDLNFVGDFKVNNTLDKIVQLGINYCKDIYKNDFGYEINKVNF